ncbi:hypothetical protein BJX63DRAFT_411835 [Aspergillus granulosus]|uniref:Uncharacterized protein n=1 Tax=Aspergillus granulosus TaxID=176169 RepID=A0ABR4GWK9_9EURO
MTWSVADIVTFVTLIKAIPTSIAGVWTLLLHLQARRARQAHLADTVSNDINLLTESAIPLLQQQSPSSAPATSILHINPAVISGPALPQSITPPDIRESHARTNSLEYGYYIRQETIRVTITQPQPSPIYTEPHPVQEV